MRAYQSLLLILCLLSAPGLINYAIAESPLSLRLVTFNAEILTAPRDRPGYLNKFRFDHARNLHLERVAMIIETLNPDVLNLVEVTSKEAVDRLIEILHEKGRDEYQGWHIDSHDSFTGMDVAVISKYPLDKIDGKMIRTLYSDDEDPTWQQAYSYKGWNGEQRNGMTSLSRNSLYFITINGWKLGFLGLHLKSNPSDDYSNAKRTAEAAIASRAINSEIVKRGYLPVVLGDLNDYDPDIEDPDDSRSTLTSVVKSIKDYDPESRGEELVNVAKWIKRKADRYTSHWDWNENGAHDGDDVYTMIDHILLPKQLEPFVKHAFISHCVGLDTSDHYPVVVDLELPATPK